MYTHTRTHRLHLHLWPPGATANSEWTVVWNPGHTHCHSNVSPPHHKKLVLLHSLACPGEHQWVYSSVQPLPEDICEGVCCPHLRCPVSEQERQLYIHICCCKHFTLFHAHMHTYTCTHTHTHVHMHTHTCTRTHAHTHTHMHTHTCTCTHAHAHVHIYTHTCTRTHARAQWN